MTKRRGIFLERPNRFVARVRMADGSIRLVHVASSGRMNELLLPGVRVIIGGDGKAGQKTTGRLCMVEAGFGNWVSVDTGLPGRLLAQALRDRSLRTFAAYDAVRPEYRYGDSRIDFLLTAPDQPPCLLEVKSVTSVLLDPDGTRVARFPDAPTTRGTRHVRELMAACQEGYRTAVCFLVQRDDVDAFGPHEVIDPAFAETLRVAKASGLEIHAWSMRVSPDEVALHRPLPLRL